MTSIDPVEGVVTRHLQHLRVRNLRQTSIYNRKRVLARLAYWARGPILYLSAEDLARWQRERATAIGPEAVRMELSGMREFYRWAVRESFRADDPTARLDMPRVRRRMPRPMPDARVAHAIGQADPEMAAIIGLAAFAGLRACEIARLEWADVGTSDGTDQIRIVDGKGGKWRIVPICPGLAELLAALPHSRGPVVHRAESALGHVQPWTVSRRANTYLHRVGVVETLHQCRHRFASATFWACRDIRAVQELLGHSSPSTTAIYVAVSPTVAIEAVYSAGKLASAA